MEVKGKSNVTIIKHRLQKMVQKIFFPSHKSGGAIKRVNTKYDFLSDNSVICL
jgi:hypothetical protein